MSLHNAFNALKRVDAGDHNGTATVTQLPANILEAFIPGYSIIAGFLQDAFGFDITLVVSVCLLLFGLVTTGRYIWSHAYEQFERYCMSYVLIDSDDDIYDQIMDWIALQKVSKRSRKLIAKTDREESWDFLEENAEEFDSDTLINFSNLDAKVPPKFQPSFGTHYFYHRGNFFAFKRGQKQVLSSGWGGSMIRDEEDVTLTCIGRSTQPIKDLIAEARQHFYKKERSSTCVRRPAPKEHRNRARFWSKVATRPSRPMHTVVLDHDQKSRVLNDINEYLHPATKFWYAHRGIPYRRGYLFHGPPGTGKSSLAWAIAGVFGLDIYCISLVDPTLTEEDLSMMFTSLPRRCVVLLEDIDSAGLSKRQDEEVKATDDANGVVVSNDAAKIGAEITKAFESVQKNSEKNGDKKGITLSGLLNAIDGVASHEGRVLVMTTNFPDKLDDALIRPGRIDMKVQFTNATKTQIHELFTRMYSPDVIISDRETSTLKPPFELSPVPKKATAGVDTKSPHLSNGLQQHHLHALQKPADLTPPDTPDRPATPTTNTSSSSASPDPAHTTKDSSIAKTDIPNVLPLSAEIESIAAQFAERVPEDAFTPAEIQGFLLTRKKEPWRALKEVGEWRDATIAQKERRAKVLGKVEGNA